MQVWATGFNSLGQVSDPFELDPETRSGRDVFHFSRIIEAQHVEIVYAGWAQTVLCLDGCLCILGLPFCSVLNQSYGGILRDLPLLQIDPEHTPLEINVSPQGISEQIHGNATKEFKTVVGLDSHGLQAMFCESSPGSHSFYLVMPSASTRSESILMKFPTRKGVHAIAMTSSGVTAVAIDPRTGFERNQQSTSESLNVPEEGACFEVIQFPSFEAFVYEWLKVPVSEENKTDPTFMKGKEAFTIHMIPGVPEQLVASALSFTLLTKDGTVWTWATEHRYSHALGRDTSGCSSDPTIPGVVEELAGLKIVRITSGVWISGAISDAGEAWIWGWDGPNDAENEIDARRPFSDMKNSSTLAGEDSDLLVKIQLPGEDAESDDGKSQNKPGDDDEDELEIVDLAIGQAHLLVLDSRGVAWCAGSNDKGQLGLKSSSSLGTSKSDQPANPSVEQDRNGDPIGIETTWKTVPALEQARLDGMICTKVACGDFSSFAVLERETTI